MPISLYTLHLLLNTIAVVAHDISNLAAVIVPMFAFLNGAMVTSTRRYLLMEPAKGKGFVSSRGLSRALSLACKNGLSMRDTSV